MATEPNPNSNSPETTAAPAKPQRKSALLVAQENQVLLRQILDILRNEATGAGAIPEDPVLPAGKQPAVVPPVGGNGAEAPSGAEAPRGAEPAAAPGAEPNLTPAPTEGPTSEDLASNVMAPPHNFSVDVGVEAAAPAMPPASPEAAMRSAMLGGLQDEQQKPHITAYLEYNNIVDLAAVPDHKIGEHYTVLQDYLLRCGAPQLQIH